LLLTATASARPAVPYTFTYANVTDASPLFKTVGDLLVTKGKKVDIDVKRFNNNFDPQAALTNAQLMVQQRPDLIIDWPGVEIGKALGDVFARGRIPCIAVNQSIPGCPFFNLVNRNLGVGAANIVASVMKQKGWTGKDTTVLMAGIPTVAVSGEQTDYFYSRLSKQIPGMTRATPKEITPKTTTIGKLPSGILLDGKGALEPAYQVIKATLQTLPKNRHLVVLGINVDMSLGAWRAITESGRQKNTLIVGQGGSADGLKNLRTNPSWVAEGSVFFEYWPDYLLAMGVAMLNGVKPPPLTYAPQKVLSKQTVNEYYRGNVPRKVPPLHKQNQYLLKTGILQKLGSAG
jgi:ribose transport system substrate-binding protein